MGSGRHCAVLSETPGEYYKIPVISPSEKEPAAHQSQWLVQDLVKGELAPKPLQLSVGEIRKSSNPDPAASVRGIGGNVMAGGAS
jgi:hypothetical protein